MDILDRIIEPQLGSFSEAHARYVLSLDFEKDARHRYVELAASAQIGILNADEQAELDDFLSANAMLTLLQSKARASLRKINSAV